MRGRRAEEERKERAGSGERRRKAGRAGVVSPFSASFFVFFYHISLWSPTIRSLIGYMTWLVVPLLRGGAPLTHEGGFRYMAVKEKLF